MSILALCSCGNLVKYLTSKVYMYMKRKHKILFKCDVFGVGGAVSGGLQAAGNVGAAMITADASNYAADQAYQGALATNQANIDIANKNNATLLQNQRETNAANLQLAQQQNEWNLEQWNRQNEYNSPSNQMKLYKEAGLNPVLAQGNFSPAQELMSADLANQQPVSSLQQPNLINPAADSSNIRLQGALSSAEYLKNAVGDAVQIARGVSEISKINKETKLTESEIKKTLAEFEFVHKQTDWYDKLSDADLTNKIHLANQLRANTSLLNDQKDKVKADAALTNFELGIKKKFIDVVEKMPQAELDVLMSQIAANKANASLSSSQTALNHLIENTGTQIPSVKSPTDQFLWDAYNFITDDGKLNIFKVLFDSATGNNGSDSDVTMQDVIKVGSKIKKGANAVKRHYKAMTGKGPGGRASHDPLPGSRSSPF